MSPEERAENVLRTGFDGRNGSQSFKTLIATAIREAEDAAYERAAARAIGVAQAQAAGWYENPKTDGCGGGIAASNTGMFAAESIRSLKSQEP